MGVGKQKQRSGSGFQRKGKGGRGQTPDKRGRGQVPTDDLSATLIGTLLISIFSTQFLFPCLPPSSELEVGLTANEEFSPISFTSSFLASVCFTVSS